MNNSMLVTLIQNAALLLAMVVVFDLITSRRQLRGIRVRQALVGMMVGGLCIALMMDSFRLESGIIFDTRSVLLSASGLFLGVIPTLFAMVPGMVYRLWLGGPGALTGVLVILSTGAVGILWRNNRRGRLEDISALELYGFGVVVHLVMLPMMLAMEWTVAWRVLAGITLPVLLVYPLSTVVLGLLLANRVLREKTAADLATSEERSRLALSAAHMGTYEWDITANRVVWSPCHEALWGFKPGEFDGTYEAFSGRIHPEDVPVVNAEAARCIAERSQFAGEFRVVWPDGGVHWVSSVGEFTFDATGRAVRMHGVVLETTERKAAENEQRRLLAESENSRRTMLAALEDQRRTQAALRESRAMLDAALASMTDAVFISDAAGRFIEFNEAFATFHKFKNKEDCAKTLSEYPVFLDVFMAGGELAPLEQWAVPRALRGETATNAEYTIRRRDTGEVWVGSYSFSPIRDLAGVIVGSVVVARDITEHKRAEEAQARLAMAIEQAVEVVMITDTEGVIQYVNPAFTTVTGYTREEAIGQNPRLLKSGKQDAEFYRRMWTALIDGDVFRCRIVNRRKDGTLYEEDASFSPVRDAAGRIVNFVGVKRDVTREAELEERLRQAQKMESVGRLAGGVAHDFNNLIMGVMGYAELAREKLPPDHPAQEDLSEILSGAKRTATLTKQLLAFARKQTICPEKLDFNDAVSSMLKMLRRLVGEDIDLAWMPGANLWPVKMDPGQIDQLLANLCINARDAIAGTGKITLETDNVTIGKDYCAAHLDSTSGDYILLSVSDDGCGMTEEVRLHLFEPFFTTKDVGEGTGLGMSTVYGIIRQNNGFVNVYSEPDKGTTIRIYFPRHQEEASKKSEADVPPEVPRGSEAILLVEDSDGVRKTTTRFLEHFGYTVLEAQDPEQALRLAANYPGVIHLLLTDVILPGMSGRDMAHELSATRPSMKVLYMSGYTANVIAHRGVLDADVMFLAKPFDRLTLARKVREALQRDAPGAEGVD